MWLENLVLLDGEGAETVDCSKNVIPIVEFRPSSVGIHRPWPGLRMDYMMQSNPLIPINGFDYSEH